MRHAAIAATLLLAASCAPQGTEAERRRDAARADSSAAGYEVGPLRAAPAMSASASPSATVASVPRTPARTPDRRADTASRRDGTRARVPVVPPRTDSTSVATVAAPRGSVTPAPVPVVDSPGVPAGPVQAGEFLGYDASQKLARLRLVAGYSGVNDGLNFNGGTAGSRTLIVPLGWRVTVAVSNDDDALSHSALVARRELPVPPEPPPPAFAGAAILSLARGLPSGETEEMSFTASSAGLYLLMCGVPGHGEGGMWISLEVSESARVPAYR